ncbi:MAG TPA: hypothetical protein VHU81_11765 [Thermoanaerobaculia bacterium]|nr:hypothetical protein [Thermoanaerobaculia bacterium]
MPLVIPLLGLLGTACTSQEEKALALRSHYEVSLSGFIVVQEPQGGSALRQNVRLRAVLSHDGKTAETLPGLTLDVAQLAAGPAEGGEGREKRRWQVWAGAAAVPSGGSAPVEMELPGVDYQPGDRFRVEVRRTVPAAERQEYRELAGD